MKAASVLKLALGALILTAAVALPGCDSSDPVAVSGSEIILTATPSPVDLTQVPTGESTVLARVLTGSGVPQQDTIVFFSTTNGTVSPEDSVTDDEGKAFTTFASTVPTTATVTARSGSVTATVTIQVLGDTATSHILDTSDPVVDTNCTDTIRMTGEVQGSSGPIATTQVIFEIVPGSASPSSLTGSFLPVSLNTDASGMYTVDFTLNAAECQNSCFGAPTCEIRVRAVAAGLPSNEVRITDNL